MNLLKIKCFYCKDELTAGELDTHYRKPYLNQSKPCCYQCSQKLLDDVKRKYQESLKIKKNEEFCDYIEDQMRCRL